MSCFINASILAVAFVFGKVLFGICNKIRYQNKLKHFRQLKRIYLYLLEHDKNPKKATMYLEKDIKIEGRWLYTNMFYFDLQDEQIWEKMRTYLMEYFNYFLWKGNKQDEHFKEIISLKIA